MHRDGRGYTPSRCHVASNGVADGRFHHVMQNVQLGSASNLGASAHGGDDLSDEGRTLHHGELHVRRLCVHEQLLEQDLPSSHRHRQLWP